MKKLYEYNMSFDRNEELAPNTKKQKQDHPECWAGFGLRLMLMLLYVTSMLCLLRYDEALKITWADVHFEEIRNSTVPFRVRLDLPFRKTHQNGGYPFLLPFCTHCSHHRTGIAPFYLYPCIDKPWMCPVRLFAEWWVVSGRTRDGFVFRKKIGSRFSVDPFQCMASNFLAVLYYIDIFILHLCPSACRIFPGVLPEEPL